MPRGFNNWSPADIIKFLRRHNFSHSHTRGSHFFYVGRVGNRDRQVCVPIHGKNTSIHPKTMKGIISQSGILESEWRTNA
ncbi:MAG: type II toxin-antitoxin system HicA family toxin [Minisyncoccota bacterium]